jgi:hypothetical protein
VLSSNGFQRDLPERRSHFDERFTKEATMKGPRARELDVHRTLTAGAFGLALDLDDLWSHSSNLQLGGVTLTALDPDRRLLNACYAAVLGDPEPRLVQLRDIGLLLTGSQVDQREVRSVARRWHGEAVLAAGIRAAAEALDAGDWPLVDWARSYQPDGWSRRALNAYRSRGGTNTRVLLSGAAAPMPLALRVAYLRGLIQPSKEYRRARNTAGRPAERLTGLRELTRWRRRGLS